MGVWSTYEAYRPQDFKVKRVPLFSCELGKAHRGLLPILIGSDEPIVGNILSLAMTGEREIYTDTTGIEDDSPYFWWDSYISGGYNTVEQVEEMVVALEALDFDQLVLQSPYREAAEFYSECFASLKQFYQRAAQEKCMVVARFG